LCSYSGLGSTIIAVKESMKGRFSDYLADCNLTLATYFDPRYKLTLYQNTAHDETSEMHINNITEEIARVTKKRTTDVELCLSAGNSTDTDDGLLPENEPIKHDEMELLDFDKCMDAIASSSTSQELQQGKSLKKHKRHSSMSNDSSNLKSIKEEMRMYENMELLPRDDNLFMWWHENGPRFPLLSVLANKYLSAPPSSVESERIFSVGGNVNTPKRNRLSPDTSESLMFLHHNLRIFEFQY